MKNFLGVCLFLMSLSAFSQVSATSSSDKPDTELVPLSGVISQVKAALSEYQDNLGSGADALPPLSLAEFDFKTTTATTTGGSINFFIFKIGASHEKDTVNDVTFTYSVPKPPVITTGFVKSTKPPSLKDGLAKTIQSAAAAVKANGKVGRLPFGKLTINLQYGVKWDASGGINAPIQLITIGLSADKNKNTVQSVKLVFGQ